MQKKTRIRNFDLTRERILKETIVRGARYGVDSISTLKIASILNISEGSIFFHFKTKKNLLIETRVYINDKLSESLYTPDTTSTDKRQEMWKGWNSLCDYFLKNKDEILYLISYRHSRFFYRSDEYMARNKNSIIFDWLVASDKFKNMEKAGSTPLSITLINSALELIHLISINYYEDSEATRRYFFEIMVGWLD